jgi:hypothetical protein
MGPLPVVDVIGDWLQDRSNLLIVSGAPGVGKTGALRLFAQVDSSVECHDDFPPPDGTFEDISRLLQSALDTRPDARIAVATEIRISDKRAAGRTLGMLPVQNPWAVTIQPLVIPEVESLIRHLEPERDVSRLRALLDFEKRGYDTHFLRTREALDILLRLSPSDKSAGTITQLVKEFVSSLVYRADGERQALNPIAELDLLSGVCYEHFLGRTGDDSGRLAADPADDHRDGEVSLDWFSRRMASVYRGKSLDARTFVHQSPFLTLDLTTRGPGDSESIYVILPDALVYEYFVARGMLERLRHGEDVKLSLTSLRQLSDGMVVLFLQSEIEPSELDRLEQQCRGELAHQERLLVLFLLEDEESFVPLLRDADPAYQRWLKDFKDGAPNTFCWKMAAYQLLALGEMELEEYLKEVESEPEDERAYEFTAQLARGSGDIDKQLIGRLRRSDLRNCRGVTAIRMGEFGSLDCVLPLAEALADSASDFECNILRRELGRIIVRHKR